MTERVCDVLGADSRSEIGIVLPRMSLRVDLEMDDLDMTEAVMDMEEEFDISISDEEWEKVQTVGDVVALVTAKVGE